MGLGRLGEGRRLRLRPSSNRSLRDSSGSLAQAGGGIRRYRNRHLPGHIHVMAVTALLRGMSP